MDISITEIIIAYLYNMAYEVKTYSLNMFEYKSIIITCWKWNWGSESVSRESLPPHLSQGNDAEAADKCTGMGQIV